MTCDNCGGLIGEAGKMISGKVCQCRFQMTSATSNTSDRTIIHCLSETVLRLTARLAEVENELLASKAANEELKRDYVIQTPWNQEDAHEADLAKLGNELFKVKEQRDSYKTIAEEAMKTVETQRKELELYRDPRAAYPTKSKEEYEKEPFCPACGKWGHTSGECPQITKEKI